jgi:hypothetical protein
MPNAIANPTTRIGICLSAYALQQFDVAGRSFGRSPENLHSGIHDARKAIRRIRATLDLGRARLWPAATAVFDELRSLCRELSTARDAYAVIETLDGLRREMRDPDQHELCKRVRKVLIARHSAAVSRLLKQDRGERRFLTRLRRLREATNELRWEEIDASDVRSALARGDRRAERAADEARRTQHARMRHRWRRRLRRLRHQMTILESELDWRLVERAASTAQDGVGAPEWKALVRVSTATLNIMTDVLGHEHDLRMLRRAVRSTGAIKHGDRTVVLKLLRSRIKDAVRGDLSMPGMAYDSR